MTKEQAKEFTNKIFDLIKEAKTIEDLKKIPETLKIPSKNEMDDLNYPQIKFDIKPEEIQTLINNKILDKNLNFVDDITENLTDPLTKLLYATAWKNGDLKKIKHIIKGIKEVNTNSEQEKALVFYQFGKYLTKTQGQPIIDQHVIRAFAIYKNSDINIVEKFQKLETLNKNYKELIIDYINWLKSNELNDTLKSLPDYTYHIDKLLFATGKTIKFKKPRKLKNTGANRVDGPAKA
jgi:hypothetical protein